MLSDYFACAAIVLSILALFVSWRAYKRDVGRLELNFSNLVLREINNDLSVTLEVVNIGRRPITVKNIKVYKTEKHSRIFEKKTLAYTITAKINEMRSAPTAFLVDIREIPAKLDEGHTYSERLHSLDETIKVEVTETKGKTYWLSMKKAIKELKKQGDYKIIPVTK